MSQFQKIAEDLTVLVILLAKLSKSLTKLNKIIF